MNNVHVRRFAAPIDQVRRWVEDCWTGGNRDCFPRDVIPSWRRNPDGVDPLALVPGKTVLGHGSLRFRLREWDGHSWKVDCIGWLVGWHGFDLEPDGDGCRVTHTVWLAPSLSAWLAWTAIEPAHDWAVEAMFDRMAHALATGVVPRVTERPLPTLARFGLWLARRRRHRSGPARPRPVDAS
jgi:hypothetical protein